MIVLVDTNILLRAQESAHAHYLAAIESIARLTAAGYELCVFAQIAAEFWVVATRPTNVKEHAPCEKRGR